MPFLSRVSMVLGLKEVPPVVSALEKGEEDTHSALSLSSHA